ncbi:MAG: thioesterase, partial [Robiginitalea sp.]
MALSTRKFNMFLFIRLPAAWWCGVRLKELSDRHALASVKYRWINQNPFKSMYWAVQGMAAELATGA